MAHKRSILTPTLIAIVGFLTVCPVIMLVFGSFSTGLGAFGEFTLDKYVKAYTDPELFGIIVNTIIFVLGSSIVATGLALFLAYLNTRTDIPFKFLFRIISIIPMMIPHILFSVSWVLLLNPSNGLINLFLRQIPGLEDMAVNIYSLPGMILVEGLLDLPIAYLILAPALASFDIALEESSKVCGSTTLRTLFRVTLPVLRPAILAAFILSLVRSLASFAVPSVIGMPGRIYVLATHIYQSVATGFAADFGTMLKVNDAINIPDSEITLSFVRADGPGGQHVNKTATAVQLRFDVRQSPSLPEGVRRRLERLAGQRLTRDGVLVIDARSHRSQKQNREEALGRLIRLVQAAARPPRPRRPTKPSAASRRRRLDSKRRRARLKQQRRPVTGEA